MKYAATFESIWISSKICSCEIRIVPIFISSRIARNVTITSTFDDCAVKSPRKLKCLCPAAYFFRSSILSSSDTSSFSIFPNFDRRGSILSCCFFIMLSKISCRRTHCRRTGRSKQRRITGIDQCHGADQQYLTGNPKHHRFHRGDCKSDQPVVPECFH